MFQLTEDERAKVVEAARNAAVRIFSGAPAVTSWVHLDRGVVSVRVHVMTLEEFTARAKKVMEKQEP